MNRYKKTTVYIGKGLLWIITAFVGGFIVDVVFPTVYPVVSYNLGINEIELKLNSFIVYRLDDGNFPVAELEILTSSDFADNKTITLNALSLPKFNISYVFEPDIILTVPHGYNRPHEIEVTDTILDDILMIPPSADNFELKLHYSIENVKDSLEYRVTDDDLAKCTYWLTPEFESADDAQRYSGVAEVNINQFERTGNTDNASVDNAITIYSSLENIEYIQGSWANLIDTLKYTIAPLVDSTLFPQKYGGFYLGRQLEDKGYINMDLFPYNYFYGRNDYERSRILGINLNNDFSRVREFVHFSFKGKSSPYEDYSKNSKYSIHILYGTNDGIVKLDSLLSFQGFRSSTSKSTVGSFFANTIEFSSHDKKDSLVQVINDHMYATFGTREDSNGQNTTIDTVKCSINDAIFGNGVLIFWPSDLDSTIMNRLLVAIGSVYANRPTCIIEFDCSPLNRVNEHAPFAKPVLVFLNDPSKTTCKVISDVSVTADGKVIFHFDSVPCEHYKRWSPKLGS